MSGWPEGLLQDDCRELSRWLAQSPFAKLHFNEWMRLDGAQMNTTQQTMEHLDTIEEHLYPDLAERRRRRDKIVEGAVQALLWGEPMTLPGVVGVWGG